MYSRGDDRYIGLPIFPRRTFRHSYIFINTKSGITGPKDLVGRRVGISEFQQTASLWIRCILRDEYGVDTNSIHWFEGGMDVPALLERLPLKLPAHLRVERIKDNLLTTCCGTVNLTLCLVPVDRPASRKVSRIFGGSSPTFAKLSRIIINEPVFSQLCT